MIDPLPSEYPIDRALARAARGHLDRARAHAAAAPGDEGAVHAMRKALSAARSVLRLARPALREADWRRVDDALAGVRHMVGRDRDAAVIAQTWARLAEQHEALAALDPPDAEPTRGDPPTAAEIASALDRAAAEVDGLDLSALTPALLARGYAKSYRSTRRRMARAADVMGDDAAHRWRRAARRLRSEAALLREVHPRYAKQAVRLKKIAKALGAHHDLALVKAAMERRGDDDALLEIVQGAQGPLLRDALRRGEKALGRRPRKVRAHLEKHLAERYAAPEPGPDYGQPADQSVR